jgi:hypothetical protein
MLTNTFSAHTSQHTTHSNVWDEISAIEKHFPRIASEIVTRWADKDGDNYIDNLLLDDRGDRMGFPSDVLNELMFLAGVRWHLSHLCGTVIESTSPEDFNYSGNRAELCGAPSRTWVLL